MSYMEAFLVPNPRAQKVADRVYLLLAYRLRWVQTSKGVRTAGTEPKPIRPAREA